MGQLPPVGPVMLLAFDQPRSVGYDLVLLAHVLSAVIGIGALVVAGAYAVALRRPGVPSAPVLRYYRQGVNWAGRILFAVPVLGAALVAMSGSDWTYSDAWVVAGFLLWAMVAVVAELAVWPAERGIQAELAAAAVAAAAADLPILITPERGPVLDRLCSQVTVLSTGCIVALVVAMVVMVAKP